MALPKPFEIEKIHFVVCICFSLKFFLVYSKCSSCQLKSYKEKKVVYEKCDTKVSELMLI